MTSDVTLAATANPRLTRPPGLRAHSLLQGLAKIKHADAVALAQRLLALATLLACFELRLVCERVLSGRAHVSGCTSTGDAAERVDRGGSHGEIVVLQAPTHHVGAAAIGQGAEREDRLLTRARIGVAREVAQRGDSARVAD